MEWKRGKTRKRRWKVSSHSESVMTLGCHHPISICYSSVVPYLQVHTWILTIVIKDNSTLLDETSKTYANLSAHACFGQITDDATERAMKYNIMISALKATVADLNLENHFRLPEGTTNKSLASKPCS